MAFADRLAQSDVAVRFAVVFSGLDKIFVNFKVPSAWSATVDGIDLIKTNGQPGDDTFVAVNALMLDSLEDKGQELRPKGGAPTAGGFKIKLQLFGASSNFVQNDPIRDILTATLDRSDGTANSKKVAYLRTDYYANDTGSLTVLDNPFDGISGDLDFYLGKETINADRGTSGSIGPVNERGLYRSQLLNHFATVDGAGGEALPNGQPVTDYALSLAGRYVEVWCVTGYLDHNKDFVPYGASSSAGLKADEHARVMSGFVVNTKEDKSDTLVVECKSLQILQKRKIVERYPKGKAGGRWFGSGYPRVWVDTHNNFIKVEQLMEAPIPFAIFEITDNSILGLGNQIKLGSSTYTADTATDPLTNTFEIGASAAATIGNIITTVTGKARDHRAFFIAGETNKCVFVGISITSGSNRVVVYDGSSGASFSTPAVMKGLAPFAPTVITLKDPDSPASDLPAGLYPVSKVLNSIQVSLDEHYRLTQNEALRNVYRGLPTDDFMSTQFGFDRSSGRVVIGQRLRTSNNAVESAFDGDFTPIGDLNQFYTLRFYGRHGNRESVIRYLGFEDETHDTETVEVVGTSVTDYYQMLVTESKVPAFRWPAGDVIPPNRVYVRDFDTWSNSRVLHNRWNDDDGNPIKRAALIDGVGVVRYGTTGSTNGQRYLATVEFADLPREPASFDPEDLPDLTVVPFFENTSWPRIVLYALLSGSGSGTNHPTDDLGWEGAGVHLRSDFVDRDSFIRSANDIPQKRNQWAWLPGDTLEDLISDELVLSQQQLIIDSQGRFKLAALDPPTETETLGSDVRVLDRSNTRLPARVGLQLRRPERWIVNEVEVQTGWNNGTQSFEGRTVIVKRLDSIQVWGQQTTLKVGYRGQRGGEVELARAAATRILNLYGSPYAAMTLPAVRKASWLWEPLNVGTLTHPYAPKVDAPGLGVTDMPVRIVQLDRIFKPKGNSGQSPYAMATVITAAYRGARYGNWGPVCRINFAGGSSWSALDHEFSTTEQPLDISWFAQDYQVKIAPVGDFTTVVTRNIDTLAGSSVTFNSALPWTDFSIMWFARYNDSGVEDDQRKYVYLAGSDTRLDVPGGGTDPGYRLL